MKRVRRISLSVEHREVSISIAQTVVTSGEARPTEMPGDAAQSQTCPDCGAPWLPNFRQALQESQIDLGLVLAAILDHRLHLQHRPDGQLQVCERSLQQIKEHT